MNRLTSLLLFACLTLHSNAQDLPPVPDEDQPKVAVIRGVQPQDLALPAAVMAFGMVIAGNFMVSSAWNQNAMAMPVLVACGVVGAASIPLAVSSRKQEQRRRLTPAH